MKWLPKNRVLVPVDLSPACLYAVETALQFVEKPADLHVVHVQMPMDMAAPAIAWGAGAYVDHKTQAQESLEAFMTKAGSSTIHRTVRFGRPGPTITEYAEKNDIELIVMPSHGHSGLQRFLLGSVTEKVLRSASCPVLVLRHNPEEQTG